MYTRPHTFVYTARDSVIVTAQLLLVAVTCLLVLVLQVPRGQSLEKTLRELGQYRMEQDGLLR